MVSEQLLLLLLSQEEGFPRLMEQSIVSDAVLLSLKNEVAELRTLLSLPEMREAFASIKKGREELGGPNPPKLHNAEYQPKEPNATRSRSPSKDARTRTRSKSPPDSPISKN